MGRIQQLNDHIATLIAAGEVVTGPVSVVRELVDNALDAGATSIDVAIQKGGISSIRVADNGAGMDRDDAVLCLSRHATSKIAAAEDLTTIRTMGFRGEALAAILAVSRMRLETQRPEDTEGTGVRAAGGEILDVSPIARRPGTTIEVTDLFYNTPARREYLDSERAEGGRVVQAVTRLAIARPDVRFTLRSGDRELLNLPATEELLERIRQVHDSEFSDSLLPLLGQRGDVVVSGYVTPPAMAPGRARRITFLVNGRPFESFELKRVLANEFSGMLPSGRYPEAILSIDLPPGDVDVNVSPDKSQVRFRRTGQVLAAVTDAIRYALGEREAVVPLDPGQRSREEAPEPLSPPAGAAHGPDVSRRIAALQRASEEPKGDPEAWELLFGARDRSATSGVLSNGAPAPRVQGPASGSEQSPIHSGTSQIREARPRHGIPADPATILQISNTFLVCSTEGGMLIVDQHSAHERINYERLRERYEREGRNAEVQPLMFPEALKLDADGAALLEEMQPYLERMGFEITPAGPREMLIQAVPATLGDRSPIAAVNALMEAYEKMRGQGLRSGEVVERINSIEDRLLMTVACHAAIKKGQALSEPEIRRLWKDLVRIDLAAHDVHGRPGVVFLPSAEIARRMERTL